MGINIIDANICHNFLHLIKIQIWSKTCDKIAAR